MRCYKKYHTTLGPPAVLRIRIDMFLALLDPDPDPLVLRGMDPDPDPSIIKQK